MKAKTLQIGLATMALLQASAMAIDTNCKDALKKSGNEKEQFDLDAVKMDPLALFESLVARYRGLSSYRDSAYLVQVTHREGNEDLRSVSNFLCEVVEGELQVITPENQIRNGLGLNLPFRKTDAMKDIELRYKLWLAPHMTLKFTDEPLMQLREGIEQGFTPTSVERVLLGDKPMWLLQLQSGDGLSNVFDAKFDFFVNPDSMLIERIEGIQHLSDGSDFITTLEITPYLDSVVPESLLTG